jgi:hypothetical protein
VTAWIIDRKFDLGPCLQCGKTLDGVTTKHQSLPDPGDIMVCAYCSRVMEWDGAKLGELSDEAVKELAGDKDMLEAVDLVSKFQQSIKDKP